MTCKDSGVKLLSYALKSPNCHLEILRLSGSMVTEEGCWLCVFSSEFKPSHLRELDLSYNHPGDSGVKLLNDKLKDPNCSLQMLTLDHGGHFRITPGLQKYACDLALDPNTAHAQLILSEGNRTAKHVEKKQPYPDHPDRFELCEQVLCEESLTGRCYWEVKWSGTGLVGLTYKGIIRKSGADCWFGLNEKSWGMYCRDIIYTVWHNNKSTDISGPSSRTNRVGVYVDVFGRHSVLLQCL
ncbi:stonustoxin subunit beta-like [Cyprinus carpio]|uniref:Stonustoxin subunit beta-like n=1 Tax=Cyprinus carpio TaxID=7962 RepID=A0A9Q9W507_CYPCA|nr:stonustoxin subunit beta-like [Cyprinus carpio]